MKLFIIIVLFLSSTLHAFTPPPPTLFIPELGKSHMNLKGGLQEFEEKDQSGTRAEYTTYSGGAYLFSGFDTDLALGLGVEYVSGDGKTIDSEGTIATENDIKTEIIAPAIYCVKTLFGGPQRTALSLTFGLIKQYVKINGKSYTANLHAIGLVLHYYIFDGLSIVPFVEYSAQGQSGLDLVIHFQGLDISIGVVQSVFAKDDPDDNSKSYNFGLRFSI